MVLPQGQAGGVNGAEGIARLRVRTTIFSFFLPKFSLDLREKN
jgi:hypothetical protein